MVKYCASWSCHLTLCISSWAISLPGISLRASIFWQKYEPSIRTFHLLTPKGFGGPTPISIPAQTKPLTQNVQAHEYPSIQVSLCFPCLPLVPSLCYWIFTACHAAFLGWWDKAAVTEDSCKNLLHGISTIQELETVSQGKVVCLVGKVKHLIEHSDLAGGQNRLVTLSHLDESLCVLNHLAYFPLKGRSGWAEHLSKRSHS